MMRAVSEPSSNLLRGTLTALVVAAAGTVTPLPAERVVSAIALFDG